MIPKKGTGCFLGPLDENPPVICGLNQVHSKKNGRVILAVRKIVCRKKFQTRFDIALDPVEYPLLVIDADPQKRIAAFTTDLAPHWCGGLVDWGKKKVRIRVTSKIQIEVGDLYVRFVSRLLTWLAHGNFEANPQLTKALPTIVASRTQNG